MIKHRTFIRMVGILAAFATGSAVCHAQDLDCLGTPSETRVTVVVAGARSLDGVIRFTFYADDEERFLKAGGPIRGLSHLPAPVAAPETETCVWLPGPGHYALSIFHDANNNGEMDETWLGLPAEGFGFSNSPVLRFGPPKLDTVLFEAPVGETKINIKLQYIG